MLITKLKIWLYRKISYFIYFKIYTTRLGRNKYIKETTLGQKLKFKQNLTPQEKADIYKIWDRLYRLHSIDWDFFKVYKGITHSSSLEFYIPDSIWYKYIDLQLTNPRKSYAIDDKNFYDLYFKNIGMPRTICRIMGGIIQSPYYEQIEIDDAIKLCKEEKRVIIKKSIDSEGGKSISFWNSESDSEDYLRSYFNSEENAIIQEIVVQHDNLSRLHPNSLNTIRIMTLFLDHEVHVLSAVLRMGVGNSMVDNASSGGIVCGINPDGSLKNFACNTKGEIFKEFHPQGCRFEDISIPNFQMCIDLAKRQAIKMSAFSKLISWDFAINKRGEPVLIENNLTYGQLDFHQICNGPILGNDINFINKVFNHIRKLIELRNRSLDIQR